MESLRRGAIVDRRQLQENAASARLSRFNPNGHAVQVQLVAGGETCGGVAVDLYLELAPQPSRADNPTDDYAVCL